MHRYTGPTPDGPEDLRVLRQLAGYTRADAAALAGLHRTTWSRMEAGASRVSVAAAALLWVMAGNLPWPGWSGWFLAEDGRLYPPTLAGRGFLPGEIMHVAFVHQQVRALRRRVDELEAALRAEAAGSSAAASPARARRPGRRRRRGERR